MLSNGGLGKEFWEKSCNTTIYLINRSPSSHLDFGILEEEWLGMRISYNHLHVFGCEAFSLIPKQQ